MSLKEDEMIYRIISKQGNSYGTWQGDSKESALLKLHREAGYDSDAVWIEDGTLAFRSDDDRAIVGDVSDWTFEEEDKCDHEPDINSASFGCVFEDVIGDEGCVIDFRCKRCGSSGSAPIIKGDIRFDE